MIINKLLRTLGSIFLMASLLVFGLIFIISPGLAADLGCVFLKGAD